jgi:hypothetical protein
MLRQGGARRLATWTPEAHFEIMKENTKKNLYRLPGIVYNTCANMRAKQLVLKSMKIGILVQR